MPGRMGAQKTTIMNLKVVKADPESEILLIKGWDSKNDGRARFTPHGAFNLPDTPADARPRESIELRALVILE